MFQAFFISWFHFWDKNDNAFPRQFTMSCLVPLFPPRSLPRFVDSCLGISTRCKLLMYQSHHQWMIIKNTLFYKVTHDQRWRATFIVLLQIHYLDFLLPNFSLASAKVREHRGTCSFLAIEARTLSAYTWKFDHHSFSLSADEILPLLKVVVHLTCGSAFSSSEGW